MRSTLEELWYGNISPETVRSLRRNSESTSVQRSNTPEMKRLMEYMVRHHDNLPNSMTYEQKDIFERFDDCWSEYASLAEKSFFVYAFRIGARIAIDVLTADFGN